MSNIVWQPKIVYNPQDPSPYEFSVEIDLKFAKLMANSKLPQERRQRTQELGNEQIRLQGFNWPQPYNFLENSCLATEFHLGSGGVWLSMSREFRDIFSIEVNPIYYSHNVDTARHAYALMSLVHLWIEYAEILREN